MIRNTHHMRGVNIGAPPPAARPEPRTPDEALAVELLELTGRHVMPAEGDAVLIKAAKRLRELAAEKREAENARGEAYREIEAVAWALSEGDAAEGSTQHIAACVPSLRRAMRLIAAARQHLAQGGGE